MKTTKQRKLGVILQYTQMLLNILIMVIYTPIMLKILGQTEHGIYSLAQSIIAYLNLLSLGFGASYLRFYSAAKEKDKVDDSKNNVANLNGLYLMVFGIIGLVSLVVGFVLAFNGSIFFNDSYTNSEVEIGKTLMFFLSINLAISFPASVFTSYVTSQQQFVFQKLLNMGKTVFSPLISIIFLYLGYGSIGMVVTTTVLSIIIDIFNIIFCFCKLKMQISFRQPNFKLLKNIALFSLFIALNQIIDQINWQTDKILLGKIINGTAVSVYTVGSTINTMYVQLSTSVSPIFAPKVNALVSQSPENLMDKLMDIFIKVGRVQAFMVFLIMTGFIFFGKYFINVWAGEGYEDAYYVALLLICPVSIGLTKNMGIEIRRALNKHQLATIIMLGTAILNVVISLLLIKPYGVIGVAFGTTISLIINDIIITIYYKFYVGIPIEKFYLELLKIIPSLIVPCCVGTIIYFFWETSSIGIMVLQIVVYSICYFASVYFLGLNKSEKDLIHSIFVRRKTNV